MPTHTVTRTYKVGNSAAKGGNEIVTGQGEENFEVTIPGESTDVEVAFNAAQANLKSIMLISTQNITIETNDGASAQDTIALLAGKPLIWTLGNDGIDRCPFSNNVTALFVTNAGATDAVLTVSSLEDLVIPA